MIYILHILISKAMSFVRPLSTSTRWVHILWRERIKSNRWLTWNFRKWFYRISYKKLLLIENFLVKLFLLFNHDQGRSFFVKNVKNLEHSNESENNYWVWKKKIYFFTGLFLGVKWLFSLSISLSNLNAHQFCFVALGRKDFF